MNTIKIALVFILSLSIAGISYAQNLEAEVFNLAAKGFLQTDSFLKIKGNIKDVFILTDPVADVTFIQYPEKPWSDAISSFSKLNQEKQLTILNTDSIPITPFLVKDTVYIVDTSHILSRGNFFSSGRYFKLISSVDEYSENAKKAFLNKMVIRKNEMILSFIFLNSDLQYSVHLQNENGLLTLLKTSVLNLYSYRQHMRH